MEEASKARGLSVRHHDSNEEEDEDEDEIEDDGDEEDEEQHKRRGFSQTQMHREFTDEPEGQVVHKRAQGSSNARSANKISKRKLKMPPASRIEDDHARYKKYMDKKSYSIRTLWNMGIETGCYGILYLRRYNFPATELIDPERSPLQRSSISH